VGETVLYELDGHVVTITYNRPDALNAINGQLRADLNDAFARFRDDEFYQGLASVKTWRYLDAVEPAPPDPERPRETATVVMRYSDGKPAVAARRVGAGGVVLVTTSADTTSPPSRSATRSATAVLPEAVGPKIATTTL